MFSWNEMSDNGYGDLIEAVGLTWWRSHICAIINLKISAVPAPKCKTLPIWNSHCTSNSKTLRVQVGESHLGAFDNSPHSKQFECKDGPYKSFPYLFSLSSSLSSSYTSYIVFPVLVNSTENEVLFICVTSPLVFLSLAMTAFHRDSLDFTTVLPLIQNAVLLLHW